MGDDDELFGPKPSAVSTSNPQTSTPRAAVTDVRAIPRAVGALLCALGRPTDAEIARANQGLARLALPQLSARDLVQATPESLAPLVPVEARQGVASLMCELAGSQPIRARLVLAYGQLWGRVQPEAAPPSSPSRASVTPRATSSPPPPRPRAGNAPVMRWVVGKLPSHVTAPEAAPPGPGDGPYRGGDVRAPEAPRAVAT